MSTNCSIGILNEDKSVSFIYCHFDGYIEGAGLKLYKCYTSSQKINELIKLGDVSSIGEYIGIKHDFNNCPNDICNFYGRDHGETNVDSINIMTEKEYWDPTDYDHEEYQYLFKDEKWYVKFDNQITLVEDELKLQGIIL